MTVADPARRGRWIPFVFVGMFAIVVAVNATMIWIALSTAPGVEKRAFERGVNYNELLEERRQQAALGWQVEVQQGDLNGSASLFEVTVGDSMGGPMADARVLVQFRRPAQAGLDFDQELPHQSDGRFSEMIQWPAAGVWDAEITVIARGHVHHSERRLFLR